MVRQLFPFIIWLIIGFLIPLKAFCISQSEIYGLKGRLVPSYVPKYYSNELMDLPFIISAKTEDGNWYAFDASDVGDSFHIIYAQPIDAKIVRLGFSKFGFDTVSIAINQIDSASDVIIKITPWTLTIGTIFIESTTGDIWYESMDTTDMMPVYNLEYKSPEFKDYDETEGDTIYWMYERRIPFFMRPNLYILNELDLNNRLASPLLDYCNKGELKITYKHDGKFYIKESNCVSNELIELLRHHHSKPPRTSYHHMHKSPENLLNAAWTLKVIQL